ncbi:hypothetical protein D3C85_625750 [compost metagenome]|jgi:uncharacterized membrane protein YeaQ/YmgE (transglycosylase-associated protein family)
MGWIAWIVLGALAGWIAKAIMKEEGGLLKNIIVGIVGALLGGFLFGLLGGEGVDDFSIYSLFVAVIGAIVLIFLLRLATGRRA